MAADLLTTQRKLGLILSEATPFPLKVGDQVAIFNLLGKLSVTKANRPLYDALKTELQVLHDAA